MAFDELREVSPEKRGNAPSLNSRYLIWHARVMKFKPGNVTSFKQFDLFSTFHLVGEKSIRPFFLQPLLN